MANAIKGYEGLYEITRHGDVFSLNYNGTGKRKKLKNTRSGYYVTVRLYKNNKGITYRVHRLVGMTYLGLDANDKTQLICHKNDNGHDNRVDNLFVGTYKDNNVDCVTKGRHVSPIILGEERYNHKLTKDKIIKIRKLITIKNITQKTIGKMFGVGQDVISNIKNKKAWSHI